MCSNNLCGQQSVQYEHTKTKYRTTCNSNIWTWKMCTVWCRWCFKRDNKSESSPLKWYRKKTTRFKVFFLENEELNITLYYVTPEYVEKKRKLLPSLKIVSETMTIHQIITKIPGRILFRDVSWTCETE